MHSTLLASALVGCAAVARPAVMPARPTGAAVMRTSTISMADQMAALLWDCDGVLADTERDGHRVSPSHSLQRMAPKVQLLRVGSCESGNRVIWLQPPASRFT